MYLENDFVLHTTAMKLIFLKTQDQHETIDSIEVDRIGFLL